MLSFLFLSIVCLFSLQFCVVWKQQNERLLSEWIRKDKIGFMIFFFDQSLSKFSIQINFVVILTAQTGEFFQLCVLDYFKVNYNGDV